MTDAPDYDAIEARAEAATPGSPNFSWDAVKQYQAMLHDLAPALIARCRELEGKVAALPESTVWQQDGVWMADHGERIDEVTSADVKVWEVEELIAQGLQDLADLRAVLAAIRPAD